MQEGIWSLVCLSDGTVPYRLTWDVVVLEGWSGVDRERNVSRFW